MPDLRQQAAAYRQQLSPQQRGATSPPQETGKRLATFEREDGELRMAMQQFEGHHYVRLQWWRKDAMGVLWPVKGQGCSIKLRELPDLAEGVALALEEAQKLGRPRPAPKSSEYDNVGVSDLPPHVGARR